MQITIKNVRLAGYPALFEAQDYQGDGNFKFKGTFIIDPEDPQIKEINLRVDEVAKEKWKEKSAAILKSAKAGGKGLLQDGDVKDAEKYPGFAGNLYINATNDVRPTVLDRNKSPLAAADGKPYGGCYVDVSLELWAQDNAYGKRINAKLRGVRFVKDGEAFGPGVQVANENEFDDLADGADDEGELA